MTDFDVLSLTLRSPLHYIDFDMDAEGVGHLRVETLDEMDALFILFSFENAIPG